MTINLHAIVDFKKGDSGHASGHQVMKSAAQPQVTFPVIALQDVKAGTNGWFNDPAR